MGADTSVIIVSYNTKALLKDCLTSLFKEIGSQSVEVIVVDNASQDGSVNMVREEFPAVHLIALPKNSGFGPANNVGFKEAKGKYVILLNSDAFFHEGALKRILEKMENNLNVGIGGGKLVGADGKWQPSCRPFPTITRDFLTLSGILESQPPEPIACSCDWVPGAFMIIRKELLDKLQGFDERFFFYFEEVDLCLRAKKLGFQVWYFPDVVITHLGGASAESISGEVFRKQNKELTLWRMRSALLYYRKHQGYFGAFLAYQLETLWHKIRKLKNFNNEKRVESEAIVSLMQQAWQETKGGAKVP